MSIESMNFFQRESTHRHVKEELLDEPTEVENDEEFDLFAFFGENKPTDKAEEETGEVYQSKQTRAQTPDLLVSLRDDANESIATLTTKVTADTFAAGASLTSSVFSALGSLVGSCGVFCAHSIGALGQAGSSLSGVSGLSGMRMPGFSVDEHGHFHLDGNIDSLSKATGFSKSDWIAGKYSAQDILTAFFSAFGEGIYCLFGFGLIDCLLDGLLPGISSKTAA